MKGALLLCLLAVLPAAPAVAQEPPAATASIDRLGWLAGAWRMEKAGRIVDEHWMAPAGGVMLGMSRTVAKGKVVEHEFIQIRAGPDQGLFYVASPVRQKETTFKAVRQADHEVVFENKEHDFPQVVGYRLQADGTLQAWIEGPRADGTTRRVEFAYRRTGS